MKYRILEKRDNLNTYYVAQYKWWGLWRTLKNQDNPHASHFIIKFRTIEDAEAEVLFFLKIKHNKTVTTLKKEGEVK